MEASLLCLASSLLDHVLVEHLLGIGRFRNRNRNRSAVLQLITYIVSVYRTDVVYNLFPGRTHLVCCPLLTIIEYMFSEGST
jgi:hypothetical protein